MMRISATGSRQFGFTLIELLVVLVIMSISFALVTLSIHVADPHDLTEDATRLVATLNQAHDIEDITGSPVILTINCQGWQYLDGSLGGRQPLAQEQVAGGHFTHPLDHFSLSGSTVSCQQDTTLNINLMDSSAQFSLSLNSRGQSAAIHSDSLGRFSLGTP